MQAEDSIIAATQHYVRSVLAKDSTGHDWWHVYRVWRTAKYIATKEDANLLIVELAALLHDIADWKFHDGDMTIGPQLAKQWLTKLSISESICAEVCTIIQNTSFKGAKVQSTELTIEGKIVQDADRLDALGAIGIGRTFAYGGYKGRAMYDPAIQPTLHESFAAYQNNQGTTLNHFHEKLFLLKNSMNTQTGKQLACERHLFMEQFVQKFLQEWELDFLPSPN